MTLPEIQQTQASALAEIAAAASPDAVEALRRAETLDREHLTQLLFGDLDIPANADNRTIGDAITRKIEEAVTQHFGGLLAGADKLATLGFMLVTSGATLNECVAAVAEGRTLPNAPFVVDMSPKFQSVDGTAAGGREALLVDINRQTGTTMLISTHDFMMIDRFPARVLVCENGTLVDTENEK